MNSRSHIYYFIIISIISVIFASVSPKNNWDLTAYIACAMNYDIKDSHQLHQLTFKTLKTTLSNDDYLRIKGPSVAGNYRNENSLNPKIFNEQLNFYKMRYAYTFGIYLLNKLGINIIVATYLLTIFASILGLWVLFVTFMNRLSAIYVYLLPIMLAIYGFTNLIRLSTPDALAFLFTTIIINLFLNKKHTSLSLFLPIGILLRTDLILLIGFIYIYQFFYFKKLNRYDFIGFFTSLALYFLCTKISGHYGWKTLFHFQFIEKDLYPGSLIVTFSFKEYVLILLREITHLKTNVGFMVFMVIFFLNLKLTLSNFSAIFSSVEHKRIVYLQIILSLFAFTFFLIFPGMAPRHMIGTFTIFTCLYFYLLPKYKIS
tara:strand:+ start:462 stop:1580 length:1119 start_codon:yes stop_codon:yes gene_type:complete